MANISELLKKIKSARYGRDVRDSIHDAIQAMNTDIENNVPAVQNLTERAESASSSAKTYSTDASAAATNAKNYSDSAKQYSELAASAIARAYDTETTANKHIADTIESPMLVTNATRNLLNPTLGTYTQNGITCTANGDGTYTLTGTEKETASFAVQVIVDIVGMYVNKDLWLVGCPKNGALNTYRMQFWSDSQEPVFDKGNGGKIHIKNIVGDANIAIVITKGVHANNLVFKPMLTTNLNATYDDFVPYSGYDIKTCGKNLLSPVSLGNNIKADTNGVISAINTVSDNRSWEYSKRNFDLELQSGEYTVVVNVLTVDTSVSYKGVVIVKEGSKDYVDCISNVAFTTTGIKTFSFIISDTSVKYGLELKLATATCQIAIVKKESNPTYEHYQESSVHVDPSTEFPLLGLKSFNGETNIISPGNVEVSHALTDTGKYVMQNMKDISDIKAAIVASGSTTE